MKSKKAKQTEQAISRPCENPNFFGHEDALQTMFAAHRDGNMPGAWLISGPRGIGKATLVYRFIKFILYNSAKSEGFFGQSIPNADLSIPATSPVFSKVSIGSHPDILVLEAGSENSKSTSGDILVDDARRVGSFLHLTASETPYRIVIIDSIDDMNTNAANSILKLLEEPPQNAMFFLISHASGRLLPTIKSRCRQIKMRGLGGNNAIKVLQSIVPDITDAEATKLIELASGSPGCAYDLYINKGLEIYANIINIFSNLPRMSIQEIQKLGDSISGKNNEEYWRVTKILLNKIIVDITKNAAQLNNKSDISGIKLAIGVEKLVDIWEEINNLLEDADNLHLDRKAVLVKIFALFAGK